MGTDGLNKSLNLLPFGIPTLIIAEDPQLLSAAAAAYAHWLVEAPVAEPIIEIRLETGSSSTADVSLDIAVDGSRIRLKGRGAAGIADSETGKAKAALAPSLPAATHPGGRPAVGRRTGWRASHSAASGRCEATHP